MKRTLIGALCLSLLATGCSDQPQQPEAEPESQPSTSVETPDVQRETDEEETLDIETLDIDMEELERIQAQMKKALEASAVLKAIEEHDVETLRKLLKEGADLTLQPSGNTYATECVLANFPEGLKVLKEFNFDFDMRNERNCAPALLCVAAKGGDFNRLEMARILLECGASVDAEVMNLEVPSLNGLTAFTLAMGRAILEDEQEAFAVARFLLEHGANPDRSPVGDNGQTVLQVAIFEKNLPAVEFLLKHGASVTKERYDGATALKIVAQRGTPAKIRQAVAANAKVCDFTIFGITLGQPLPREIEEQVKWIDDSDLIWDGDLNFRYINDNEATWRMPKRFRRFKQEVELTRTPSSHRISCLIATAPIDGELQQKEEAEVVRDAFVKKFGIDFEEDPYRQRWTGYKDGAEIHIWYLSNYVGLMISVADKETLQLIDDLSRERADDVETDLDVL